MVKRILVCISCFAVLFTLGFSLVAQNSELASPYFLLSGGKSGVENFPLKSTNVEVSIAGMIADVTITQVYENNGKENIEAIYIFPCGNNAAVYSLDMKIGERILKSVIRKKEVALKEYQIASSQGKKASLLEQERPNVFQMHVANIGSGDHVEVVLRYTELLTPSESKYQFVFPMVVGPRYSEDIQNGFSGELLGDPYLKAGMKTPVDFHMKVFLTGGMPLQEVSCLSHKVTQKWESTQSVWLEIDSEELNPSNRDFILDYRLAGGEIQSGVLLYEHGDENFFMAMVQPPKQVPLAHIPPKEYIFILDISGSMRGFPLDIAKKLVRDILVGLRPTDQFNILTFAGGSDMLSEESLEAKSTNIEKAMNWVENLTGSGTTELLPALRRALAIPSTPQYSRSFVVVTDGYITVEKECFDLIANNLNQANLFPFGIGQSVNRHLIAGMAHVGMSDAFIVSDEAASHEEAERFRKYINSPVLSHVNMKIEGFGAYDIEPTILPDLMGDRPLVIIGKYKGSLKGKIELTGTYRNETWSHKINISEYLPSRNNKALRFLWARKRIQLLDDYGNLRMRDEKIQDEVVELGLKYSIMTQYTSFVAVDEESVIDSSMSIVKVVQPLPLPNGMSGVRGGNGKGKYRVSPLSGVRRVSYSPHPDPIQFSDIQAPCDSQKLAQLENWFIQNRVRLKGLEKLLYDLHATIDLEVKFNASGKVNSVKSLTPMVSARILAFIRKEMKHWKFTQFPLSNELSVNVTLDIIRLVSTSGQI